MNPFDALIRSRKFWIAVFEAVTSTLVLLVGLQSPENLDTVKLLLAVWNTPFMLLIIGITVEDAAEKRAGLGEPQVIAVGPGDPE
jgi:hypothetical protein